MDRFDTGVYSDIKIARKEIISDLVTKTEWWMAQQINSSQPKLNQINMCSKLRIIKRSTREVSRTVISNLML